MHPFFLVLPHSNKNKHGENAGSPKMWLARLVLTTKVLYLLVGVSDWVRFHSKYLPFSSARADELITLPGCCCSHSTRSTIGAVMSFSVNDFHVCSDNTVNMDMVVLSLRR